jgi:hypothetical protein
MFSLMNIQLITVTVRNDHHKYVVKHQLHIWGTGIKCVTIKAQLVTVNWVQGHTCACLNFKHL